MSEQSSWSRPTWPHDCPEPGAITWPDGAVRWLTDAVPANRWRHKHLAADPWLYALAAVLTVRGQLEQAREDYPIAVGQWARQLPQGKAAAFVKATQTEGRRLATLLTHVMAVEDALSADKLRPGVRPPG